MKRFLLVLLTAGLLTSVIEKVESSTKLVTTYSDIEGFIETAVDINSIQRRPEIRDGNVYQYQTWWKNKYPDQPRPFKWEKSKISTIDCTNKQIVPPSLYSTDLLGNRVELDPNDAGFDVMLWDSLKREYLLVCQRKSASQVEKEVSLERGKRTHLPRTGNWKIVFKEKTYFNIPGAKETNKKTTEIKHKPNAIGIPENSITTVATPTTSPNNKGSITQTPLIFLCARLIQIYMT